MTTNTNTNMDQARHQREQRRLGAEPKKGLMQRKVTV